MTTRFPFRSRSFVLPAALRGVRSLFAAFALALLAVPGFAADPRSVGMTQLAPAGADGPVTLFYPSTTPSAGVQRGPFRLALAEGGVPVRGNGRLVVISHGSGGSPWVHADLARALVEGGFFVAAPEHRDDNSKHDGKPGPESWTLRPGEVSRAIDAVERDGRYAPLLDLRRVGMYGMSAGGHTALTLAGGRWSPALFSQHCEAHIEEDFQTCVGLITKQTGSAFDGLRRWIARTVIELRFGSDAAPHAHDDPRIAAVVADVPLAADFDPDSLRTPRVPLGIVSAAHDLWLVPRFHSQKVLDVCVSCEHVADFPTGGHGALLSPPPPQLGGLVGELLNDPPGFDRSSTVEVDRRITAFFTRHLLPL